jgi:hypothetical protein
VNIHCYDNPCFYGNALNLDAVIEQNAIIWFDNNAGIRISDFLFKNYFAGKNTKIVVVGMVKE